MGETGFVRFPGCLDPRAEEFRPGNLYIHNQMPLFQPQIYYRYPPSLSYPPSEVQIMPFYDGYGGLCYPQFDTPPAYVRRSGATPPLPPPLPPPSAAPTRTLLLSSVPTDVSESEVRRELEVFGDVRAVQMERRRDGIVTAHFYNLRHAEVAAAAITEQHMQQQTRLRLHFAAVVSSNSVFATKNPAAYSLPPPPIPPPARGLIAGHAVWAQFTIPVVTSVPDGHNQGTLVIFNLDPDFPTYRLKSIFEAFGAVKELRETPLKRQQRFVEFYDTRDAAKALTAMNGKTIDGTQIVIEFSRAAGQGKRFSKSIPNTIKTTFNYPVRNSRCLTPPPPPPPPFSRNNLPSCGKKSGFCNGKASENGNCNNNRGVVNKGQSKSSGGGGKHQKQQQQTSKGNNNGNGRAMKGRHGKKFDDPGFLINEDAIMESNCRDSRTTVMIKNIPNKYSQKLLLNMLDNHCIHCNEQIANGGGDEKQPLSSYDFVYLPIDFINKCNVGYGFVNMTSPEATWRLYKAFHLQNWEVFNSKKICEVTYARLQGVDALKEHFKNSKFPCEADEYLPVVFSPPRDGRLLTEPIPVVARTNSSPFTAVTSTDHSSDGNTDEHDDINAGSATQAGIVNGHNNNNNNNINEGGCGNHELIDEEVGGGSCSGGDDEREK